MISASLVRPGDNGETWLERQVMTENWGSALKYKKLSLFY